MRWRWITLFVGLYIVLDFANPMLPGAVQLVDGTIETVAGCQGRPVEPPPLTPSALPRHHSTVERRHDPSRQAPRILAVALRPPVVVRVTLEPCSCPASSSDDD